MTKLTKQIDNHLPHILVISFCDFHFKPINARTEREETGSDLTYLLSKEKLRV